MNDKTEVPMRMQRLLSNCSFYDTAEECANAAAPIFQKKRWRWTRLGNGRMGGIPTDGDILATLHQLAEFAEERETKIAHTGRLFFYDGRFGHETP